MSEWVKLIQEAKLLGITKEEAKSYIQELKKQSAVTDRQE